MKSRRYHPKGDQRAKNGLLATAQVIGGSGVDTVLRIWTSSGPAGLDVTHSNFPWGIDGVTMPASGLEVLASHKANVTSSGWNTFCNQAYPPLCQSILTVRDISSRAACKLVPKSSRLNKCDGFLNIFEVKTHFCPEMKRISCAKTYQLHVSRGTFTCHGLNQRSRYIWKVSVGSLGVGVGEAANDTVTRFFLKRSTILSLAAKRVVKW